MDIQQAYNNWASQYDTNQNRTRDLEGLALRQTLAGYTFENCLEIGCGTGKNTIWLLERARQVTAVDLSEEMLALAKEKIASDHVRFLQADIREDWNFVEGLFDLVSFSLVLEHIRDLEPIFAEVTKALKQGGMVYIGELHPFKQYTGTKARFDTPEGRQEVECFTHHTSDFVQAASKHGLVLVDLSEHFDEKDRATIPRILTLLFRKS
jgi:ubiquinone/menaquinone biosynthesis C-methylase UbiE